MGYMDWQKYTVAGKNGGGYQQYMDWQKYMGGAGKNSSYQKYMDWSNGYQKYMDWQKYMGGNKNGSKSEPWQKYMSGGKSGAGGYQKYMDWQKYTGASSLNALPSKEYIGDSPKYTQRATPLVLLLCAVSAFAVGFVFIREKLSRS